ncbi:MAG: long-chain fatty acid transporter [Gammaproteobacteria bacterium]|nr:long-chain fatty acid transporter [Gammaproteobacteria bacterium]
MNQRQLCSAAIAAALFLPATAFATNGYFLIGYGAKSRSMGGVGVAYAQDALAGAANPAGMADVESNVMRFDMGGEFFLPKRAASHDSVALESNFPGSDSAVSHRSGSNVFLIPSMGFTFKFNRDLTVGMAVIGNGANTRYDQTVPGKPNCMDSNFSDGSASTLFNFNCIGSQTAGVSLMQMQMLPGLAYKLTENHTLGASLIIAVQQFRAYGLQAFGQVPDPRNPGAVIGLGFGAGSGKLTNEGNDWSYGAGFRLGWLGKFIDGKLSLGANYASKTHMSKFDKYKNLFAGQGGFDIPEHWALGLAYELTDKLTVAADYQKINYNDIPSVGNPGPDPSNPSSFFPSSNDCPAGVALEDQPCALGRDKGLGFGWNDAEVYKIGINYDYNSQWSFRAGYNYAETPIQKDQILFNFLAPAVNEHHITLGLSYRPSPNIEWSANYMHAFSNTIKGPTPFGPQSGLTEVGENAAIDMRINSIGISFGYRL